jgi:hypothetical protein
MDCVACGDVKMLENMVPVTLVHGNNIQTTPQQYPIQEADDLDVLKFKLELEAGAKTPPIFEVTNKASAVINEGTVLGLIQNIDTNYHHVLTNMKDLRHQEMSFELKGMVSSDEVDAVRTRSAADMIGDEFVRTPDDVSNRDRARYKELLANQEENQTKAMQLIHDMTNKTIGAQMFLSNLKFIGAAVSQVSQGFKTLFRSSG